MKKIKFLAAAASVLGSLLIFNACQKDQQQSAALTDEEAFMAQDNALMDNESNQIQNLIDVYAYSNNLIGVRTPGFSHLDSILPSCATVTADTSSMPRVVIINFGNTPCLCTNMDGRYRQGEIKITWTGRLKDAETVMNITTNNYFRGVSPDSMNELSFAKTVINNGLNADSLLAYRVSVNAMLTTFDGKTATWQADQQKVFIHGENTPQLSDDVFSITGNASGVNRFGNSYQSQITSPIIVDRDCQWPVKGVVSITRSNRGTETLDYGDGTCDNLATIDVNGRSREITLR